MNARTPFPGHRSRAERASGDGSAYIAPDYVETAQTPAPKKKHRVRTAVIASSAALALVLGGSGPPPSFGPVAVRVVGFQLMGALPSVVDRCEVSER